MRIELGRKRTVRWGLIALLAVGVGCKKDSEGPESEGMSESEGERGPGHEGGQGGPEGDDDRATPWPPPGEKTSPPPGVKQAFEKMVNGINAGDADAVKGLFLNRQQFLGVSDCEPKDVVDRVLEGRNNWTGLVKDGKTNVTFKNYTEGYLLSIKRGEKPAECRAKVTLKLYQTRYNWVLNGRAQEGEAHFLEVSGAWFFVKL